jgi:hypothetical protein
MVGYTTKGAMLTMRKQRNPVRAMGPAFLAAMLVALAFTSAASAKLVGEYERFQFCPWKNTEVKRCTHAVTEGGEVVLGSKKSPIINDVTLQGGFSAPVGGFSKFFAATNGVTLEPVGQPVPGGLLGLVPPEASPPLIKALVELAAENGLTGVDAVLELARPASEIVISETNLAEGIGLALKLPVMVKLENPFLGNNCYVGSEAAPIYWELTAGTTEPPEPNKPITGESGEIEFIDGGRILGLFGNELVDNAWAAPKASGCGIGLLSLLVDPVINVAAGLPAKAGLNTAILENTVHVTSTAAVKKNDEENP